MTTERQIIANRQNALSSTGPRTARGKAVSSRNNTRHGLRATTPVIPRLESPEDWEQHRATTIAGLAPATVLEEALAERVALILWRLDRVARYERDVTSQSQERAPADLANAEGETNADDAGRDLTVVRRRYNEARRRARVLASLDDRPADAHLTGKDAASALAAIGEQIPDFIVENFYAPEIVSDHLDYDAVPDWTVDRLLRFVAAIASANDRDPEQLRADALDAARRQHNAVRIAYRRLTRQLRDLRRQRILPQAPNLDQVVRYETHLMRQLSQSLGHLKQLQQTRARPPLPLGESWGEGSLLGPYDDYHRPLDFYDAHIYGNPPPAPTDRFPLSPDCPDDEPAVLICRGARLAPTGGGGLDFGHSNPIEAPAPPGQPQTVAGAAPDCATPAPDCAPSAPTCAPVDRAVHATTCGATPRYPSPDRIRPDVSRDEVV
jgi:hypothetical protein